MVYWYVSLLQKKCASINIYPYHTPKKLCIKYIITTEVCRNSYDVLVYIINQHTKSLPII